MKLLIFFFLNISVWGFSQEWELEEKMMLPEKLSEASGLEFLDSNTLVSINDGGHKAKLFVLNLDGSLRKKVTVFEETNRDWESLASDGEYLYIADIGNNKNTSKNTVVLKVKIADILTKKEVKAKKIYFNYSEQKSFPAEKENFNFDAEALVCIGDSLALFTKNNSTPWTGKSYCYMLSKVPGIYTLKKSSEIEIGPNGWLIDAITGADYYNGKLYLLTYNRKIQLNFAKNRWILENEYVFDTYTQKEGILIINENEFYIVDEKSTILEGGNLIKYTTLNAGEE